jgi:RimJ/RimL family protein N-acetyltransferase
LYLRGLSSEAAIVTNVNAYPCDLSTYVTLSNQKRVRIRALRRCEERPIRELYARLSPRSRYQRFFSPMPALPDAVVRLLACVDYRRKLALLAEYDSGGGEEVIGLGSFGATDDGHVEVGLVVRDDWQRLRVGTELARRVMQAAEARGFHRFIASVLSENIAMRRLLRNVGEIVSARMDGNVSEIVFIRRRHASTA